MEFPEISDSSLIDCAPYLASIEAEAKRALFKWRRKYYEPSRVLYTTCELTSGESYLIVSGLIRTTNKDNGLSFFCGRGSLLGADAVLSSGEAYRETAEVCIPTYALAIDSSLKDLTSEFPGLRQALIDYTLAQRSKVDRHIGQMLRAPKKNKLPLTLVQMMDAISPPKQEADSAISPYPFTVNFWPSLEYIAGLVDVCRPTVMQSLDLLDSEKAIRYFPRGQVGANLRILLQAESRNRIKEVLKKIS